MRNDLKNDLKNESKSERKSDRELVVSRLIKGSVGPVFEAWSNAEIFQKWWVPKQAPITLASCKMDVRTGGKYSLLFKAGDQTMEFFGKYLEVKPNSRLVWTSDEAGDENATVTTVTFEESNGSTNVVVHDLYPSKDALEEAVSSGSTAGMPIQLEQLEELITAQTRRT